MKTLIIVAISLLISSLAMPTDAMVGRGLLPRPLWFPRLPRSQPFRRPLLGPKPRRIPNPTAFRNPPWGRKPRLSRNPPETNVRERNCPGVDSVRQKQCGPTAADVSKQKETATEPKFDGVEVCNKCMEVIQEAVKTEGTLVEGNPVKKKSQGTPVAGPLGEKKPKRNSAAGEPLEKKPEGGLETGRPVENVPQETLETEHHVENMPKGNLETEYSFQEKPEGPLKTGRSVQEKREGYFAAGPPVKIMPEGTLPTHGQPSAAGTHIAQSSTSSHTPPAPVQDSKSGAAKITATAVMAIVTGSIAYLI